MANVFKNYVAADVGTSASTLITASTATTVIGMTVSNTTASPITVDVYVTISASDYYIVKGATVPTGGALVPVGGDQKVVLETGDELKVISSAATSADVIVSVLEIT
jgi:tryptophanyl-tRNA synthetase